MTTIAAIRTGLATSLTSISGLRTSATIPDDPMPPIAVINPPSITYDIAMGRGLDEYTFTVQVLVGRVSERTAQGSVDGYSNPTGAGSVKAAIEKDRTLGGACSSLRVTSMRGTFGIVVNDNTYLAAEFVVTVYA
jgi:hypothetical protein